MATEFLFKTRNEWLEGRRTLGIGSSDAPAILGISRYKSAFQLYLEKRGLESASRQENEQIAWGNLLEEPIAQRFAEETGRDVRNPREPGIWRIERSIDVDFMVAAVDRTQRDPQTIARDGEGILEIKNAHFFVGKTWLDTQEPPPEFQVQLQHQLAVTGARWGSIAALIGGCRFVWADVPRDEEFIDLLIQAEAEFWKRLTDGNPPDPDGTDATKKAIDRLFTRETSGQIIGLPPDIIDAHIELQDAKVALDKAATRKKAAENQIKLAIGENVGGATPGRDRLHVEVTNEEGVCRKRVNVQGSPRRARETNAAPSGKSLSDRHRHPGNGRHPITRRACGGSASRRTATTRTRLPRTGPAGRIPSIPTNRTRPSCTRRFGRSR